MKRLVVALALLLSGCAARTITFRDAIADQPSWVGRPIVHVVETYSRHPDHSYWEGNRLVHIYDISISPRRLMFWCENGIIVRYWYGEFDKGAKTWKRLQ